MASRSVELSEMFGWIGATFTLIGRNAAAFMGASLATLGLHVLVFAPLFAYMFQLMLASRGASAAAQSVAPFANGGTTFWVVYAITILGSLVLLPPLMVGWFRLCRQADGGAGVRALGVLAPYRDGATWARALLTTVLMVLVSVGVFALLALVFWSSLQAFVAQVVAQEAARLAGTAVAPQAPPLGFFIGYLVFLVVMSMLQFAYFVAFADISLRPTPALAAVRDALAGVGRNALKLLLFLLCVGLVALVAMVIVVVVLALLIGVLSMLGTTALVIGMLLLYVPLFLLIYPVMYASGYFVWKSMVGDTAPPALPEADFSVLPA